VAALDVPVVILARMLFLLLELDLPLFLLLLLFCWSLLLEPVEPVLPVVVVPFEPEPLLPPVELVLPLEWERECW